MQFLEKGGVESEEFKEKEGVEKQVEIVRSLERRSRLEPYQARRLIESISQREAREVWKKVVERCVNETSFFDEYDEASLLDWIKGEGDIDFPVRFGVRGMGYCSGTYSREENIKIAEQPPTSKEYLLSLSAYASLPRTFEIIDHEIIHAMQFNSPESGGFISRLKLIGRLVLRFELGLRHSKDKELTETHAYQAADFHGSSLGETIKGVYRVVGPIHADFNKVIDAALIVERCKAIGLTDQEIAAAIKRNYFWKESPEEGSLSWIFDSNHPRYVKVERLATRKNWPTEWAEEYIYAAETGNCFLALREWLINQCIDRGISPDDLELQVFESRLRQRSEELKAAFICQETIAEAVSGEGSELSRDPLIPPQERFIPDRHNLVERPTPVSAEEKIKEITKSMDKRCMALEEDLQRVLSGRDIEEISTSLAFGAIYNSLKPEEMSERNSYILLGAIRKIIRTRKLGGIFPRYVKAIIDNPQALPERERDKILGNLISLIEAQHSIIVQESVIDPRLDQNPARLAEIIAMCCSSLEDFTAAKEWYARAYNWYEELLHNPSMKLGAMSFATADSDKEQVFEKLRMLESKK